MAPLVRPGSPRPYPSPREHRGFSSAAHCPARKRAPFREGAGSRPVKRGGLPRVKGEARRHVSSHRTPVRQLTPCPGRLELDGGYGRRMGGLSCIARSRHERAPTPPTGMGMFTRVAYARSSFRPGPYHPGRRGRHAGKGTRWIPRRWHRPSGLTASLQASRSRRREATMSAPVPRMSR